VSSSPALGSMLGVEPTYKTTTTTKNPKLARNKSHERHETPLHRKVKNFVERNSRRLK